jgi:hypothetical protein
MGKLSPLTLAIGIAVTLPFMLLLAQCAVQ